MKYYVFSKKSFIDSDGKRQTKSYKCGSIKMTESGAMFLTWFAQPATRFYIQKEELENAGS